MDEREQKAEYVKEHANEFIASINRLSGFSTSLEDVTKFLSGQRVDIDISSAKGIIGTQQALMYMLDKAVSTTYATDACVDTINKMITGDFSLKLGSGLRAAPLFREGDIVEYPVCTMDRLRDILYYSSMTENKNNKAKIVYEMVCMLPFKSENVRTAILVVNLMFLHKYGLVFDTRAVQRDVFAGLIESAKYINSDGHELVALILNNLI